MTSPAPITTAELAALVGCDVRTISRWVANGDAKPAFKAPGVRGPYFFDADEVNRLRAVQHHAASP